MVSTRYDKMVFLLFFTCSLIAILVMTISAISINRVVYFLGELLLTVAFPGFIIGSFLLSILNGNITGKLFYLVRIIAVLIYFCFIVICKSYFLSTFLDIPNIVNGNYTYISGKPYDISIEGTKVQTQYFTIDVRKFSIENYMLRINLDRSKTYRITYLENSNYIIDITEE